MAVRGTWVRAWKEEVGVGRAKEDVGMRNGYSDVKKRSGDIDVRLVLEPRWGMERGHQAGTVTNSTPLRSRIHRILNCPAII